MWRVIPFVLAWPVWADSVVATRPIAAGAIISAEDVTLVSMDIQGAAAGLPDVLGQTVQTAIAPGRAVQTSNIAPAVQIPRNGLVVLVLQSGGLEIRTEGRALVAGSLGDVIDVMNLSSRSRVQGRIIAAGTVGIFAAP